MRILRSWPADMDKVSPDRAYVMDSLEKFKIRDFSYMGLSDYNDDIVMIEWDLAIDQRDFNRFIARATQEPNRVRVAPYYFYQLIGSHRRWIHRHWGGEVNGRPEATQFVSEGDPTCNLFGFGLVYLPRDLIRKFEETNPHSFDDSCFSFWHYHNVEKEVPIDWDVRPVHLHYRLPTVPKRESA